MSSHQQKMSNPHQTDYLIVKISDSSNKSMGCRCIPESWIQNTLVDNYLTTRYPAEETPITRLLVQNKFPADKDWPFYYATIIFRTDDYQIAMEFMKTKYENDALAADEELDDNISNKNSITAANSISSTSGKRKQSFNEDNVLKNKETPSKRPKKFQEPTNKIPNNITDKQKNSSEILSLRKSARTRTLNTLICTKKFETLDKLYSAYKSPAISKGSKESDVDIQSDCSNSDNESLSPPDSPESKNVTSPIYTENPKISQTTSHENIETTPCTSNTELQKESEQNPDSNTKRSELGTRVLENLLLNLQPTKATTNENDCNVNIQHLENIYNTILDVKAKLKDVYQESSLTLKKCLEAINFFVPPLGNDGTNPTSCTKPQPKSQRTKSLQQKKGSHLSKPSMSTFNHKNWFDLKWTLKHHGPGSGLIELMPCSGIYVSQAELLQCETLATDMKKFARHLLSVVFTEEALNICTYYGLVSKEREPGPALAKPELHEKGRNALLAYVVKHANKCKWPIFSREEIISCLQIAMEEM